MIESAFEIEFPLIKHIIEVKKLFDNLGGRPGRHEIQQAGLTAKAIRTVGREKPALILKSLPKVCPGSCLQQGNKHLGYLVAVGEINQTLIRTLPLMIQPYNAACN